jgi:hypothetical protein
MKYAGRWHTEGNTLHQYFCRVLAPLDIILSILDEASQGRLMIEPILDKTIQYLGPSAWKIVIEK